MSDTTDPTRLQLIRHGESNVTVARIVGGMQSCTGLSPLGRNQAERLRERYATGFEPPVDVLWSSQMPRAMETAEIIRPALGEVELHIDPDFEEHRPGDEADGVPFAEFGERFGTPDWRDLDAAMAPGAETPREFHTRVRAATDRVIEAHRGHSIAVACHGGVVDVVFRYLLDLPMKGHFNLWTLNTSITEFVSLDDADQWRLVRYNDSSHHAGLPKETPRAS